MPGRARAGHIREMTRISLNANHMKIMLTRLRIILATLVVVIAMTACAPFEPSQQQLPSGDVEAARELAAKGDYTGAAQRYESLLANLSGESLARATLLAADYRLAAGQPQKARTLLSRLTPLDLSAQLDIWKTLTTAEMYLQQGKPKAALQILAPLADDLPAEQTRRRLAVAARAYAAVGNLPRALRLMNAHIESAPDEQSRRQSIAATWQLVQKHGHAANIETQELPPEIAGWLRLGAIARGRWMEPSQFDERLQQWRSDHPDHPAGALIEQLRARHRERMVFPGQIALLLPFEGRFAEQAEAIRDGFLAAHYQRGVGRSVSAIRLYDTGDDADRAIAAYRQAVADGASFIIGPLSKAGVSAIADIDDRATTVLALNHAEGPMASSPGAPFYQFGLPPEEEAWQVAERAVLEGRTRALALVPEGDWGYRVAQSFGNRLADLGGTLLDYRTYDANRQDHSGVIRDLLNLQLSRERHAALTRTIGTRPQFVPRRRQDAEMIFLAAFPTQGRQLNPQLRFHHAGDLPVYAISHIYAGQPQPQLDQDLNGVTFADMPLTLGLSEDGLAEVLSRLWPQRFTNQPRLFALGYDAYSLIPLLRGNEPGFYGFYPGVTGTLYMAEDRVIGRTLRWARFSNGSPRVLSDAMAATKPDEN